MNEDNSWIAWRRAILQEIVRHDKILEKLTKDLISVRVNFITLKIYAIVSGGIAGIITILILYILFGVI